MIGQSKADRERQRLVSDKCQSLLEALLKDDDNKYCADCDAKGPRWASWNLGIFLCIRCAGIHRNLGVHISKVKSVNLDAWTPEQVAYMQRMGNKRARSIYEANVPDDFRRPQTDAALETMIRAKYEHSKYLAKDFVMPDPPAPAFNIEDELKRMKEAKKSKASISGTNKIITLNELPTNPQPRPAESSLFKNKVKQSTPGLVDLETVAATKAAVNSNKSNTDSLLGDINVTPSSSSDLDLFQKSPVPQEPPKQADKSGLDLIFDELSPPVTQAATADDSKKAFDLSDLDFLKPSANESQISNSSTSALTKESILSLYSNTSNQAIPHSNFNNLNKRS